MNGVLIINKQKGCTSNDIVKKVKKLLNTKVGHTGTLDPNATGVLPLLIGDATKISKYLINHNKEYEAVIKLGIKTTTADGEGEVLKQKEVDKSLLTEENVTKALEMFLGKQEQMPPIYSAIKVNGKKLYEYARSGKEVEIKTRCIEIYSIKLIKIDLEHNELIFNVKCSKGTYIRSLCEDIADKLDTVGYMKDLNRIQVGEFNIKDAVTIDLIEKNVKEGKELEIISIESIFKNNKSIKLSRTNLDKYLNGVKIDISEEKNINKEDICKVYFNEAFIGIGIVNNNKLKRDIVVNI